MCLYSEYSDFLDKDYLVPGDEYLPLGPSFQVLTYCRCCVGLHCLYSQEHVALFVCREESGVLAGRVLPGHGTGSPDELLRPETARLITQLE